MGAFPARETDFAFWIWLPDEKRKRAWSALILSYLARNRIPYQELGNLIDRIAFSQTLLFGKFAITQLLSLYQKQYRRGYNAALSAEERAVFSWWYETIISFTPRISRPLSRKFDWLLYTDAATNPPCICDLLFDPRKTSISLDAQLVAFARPWIHWFKHTCLIFGLELLVLAAFVEDCGPRLAGRPIWIYMDSKNCFSAMTRDDSNTEDIAIPVGRIRDTLHRYHISAWFSRVSSKQNPADFPTRAKTALSGF